MPVVIPNALQAVASGTNLGTPWVNTYGLVADGAFLIDQSVAQEIGDAVVGFYGQFQSFLGFGWAISGVEVRDLRTATSPSWDTVQAGFTGTAGGDALSPQTALVASHRTGLRGKSYNGRTYLGGFTEQSNAGDGSIGATTQTAVLNSFALFKADLATITGGGLELAVLSRLLEVATPITSTTVDDEWDRQNRRKR